MDQTRVQERVGAPSRLAPNLPVSDAAVTCVRAPAITSRAATLGSRCTSGERSGWASRIDRPLERSLWTMCSSGAAFVNGTSSSSQPAPPSVSPCSSSSGSSSACSGSTSAPATTSSGTAASASAVRSCATPSAIAARAVG